MTHRAPAENEPPATVPDASVFALDAAEVRFGEVIALGGVDLIVESGERVAIIGPSGAGKSTLLGLLNGTVSNTAGRVRVLGCEYARASGRQLRATRRRIGTIHQRFELVDELRALHNVNAGRLGVWPFWKAALSLVLPRETQRARTAMERVGIADKLHERTGDLSGGEQQRVAIARVLVQRPAAILADEPVASLDPVRGREIVRSLLDLADSPRVTLLASLHDVNMALENFDRVIGMRAGRIVFDQPRAGLSESEVDGLYASEVDFG